MIDILIPVLGRPERAEPLVRNITKTTRSEHNVLFLCSKGDDEQIQACRDTGADVCVVPFKAGAGDFAKKVNIGYKNTEGDYLLIGADDLAFHQGWDKEAVSAGSNAGVIGTNDLANPRVMSGRHSTHPLVRRAYIDEWGGTFDNSGTVYCELYDHQYVDDELVQTAIMRRLWVFAKDSHVEHLHPFFSNTKMDKTYKKALRKSREDQRLFQSRLRQIRRFVPRERLAKMKAARR